MRQRQALLWIQIRQYCRRLPGTAHYAGNRGEYNTVCMHRMILQSCELCTAKQERCSASILCRSCLCHRKSNSSNGTLSSRYRSQFSIHSGILSLMWAFSSCAACIDMVPDHAIKELFQTNAGVLHRRRSQRHLAKKPIPKKHAYRSDRVVE